MDILIVLIPAALILGVLGLAGFLWSLKTNQYEDLDGAARRILNDEEPPEEEDDEEAGSGKNSST